MAFDSHAVEQEVVYGAIGVLLLRNEAGGYGGGEAVSVNSERNRESETAGEYVADYQVVTLDFGVDVVNAFSEFGVGVFGELAV